MRKTSILSLVGFFSVLAGALFAWSLISHGFSSRANPSAVETIVARTARRFALPSSYRKLKNPQTPSAENVRAGMEHFADHCAVCHGNDGSGDTMFGKNMYPKPPDMRESVTQEKSDGELYYIIQNGIRLSGMPAFGEENRTDDADTWKLVLFIRHLPRLTAGERNAMEKLNPKTAEEREEEKEEEEFLRGETPRPVQPHSHP
jgi:mono/diheme cytochrome c family protein